MSANRSYSGKPDISLNQNQVEELELIRKKEFTEADLTMLAQLWAPPVPRTIKAPLDKKSVKQDELSSGSPNEELLWVYLKAGNELAFSVLYKRYVNRLYNYGMNSCKDCELVKDCLQELFVRIWSKRKTLGAVVSVRHYLFKSFRRLLVERLIANRKFSSYFPGGQANIFDFMPPIEDSIIETETKNQQLNALKSSLNALTRRQREAIFLKFFQELSYDDVSSIMELRMDSVYNLISKALDTLRSKMKNNSYLAPSLRFKNQ